MTACFRSAAELPLLIVMSGQTSICATVPAGKFTATAAMRSSSQARLLLFPCLADFIPYVLCLEDLRGLSGTCKPVPCTAMYALLVFNANTSKPGGTRSLSENVCTNLISQLRRLVLRPRISQ